MRDNPKNCNYDGTNITYDAAGNPQNWRNADDIEWLESAGKQMSLFFDSENGLYMYEYNIDNIRTKKTVCGEQGVDFLYESQYILNGTSIVRETRTYADGSVIILDFLYDDSGVILGVVYNGTTYYYRKNLQGDITGIVNASGTLVVSYTYDAWGNPVSITGSMASTLGEINPIRYRGYYYDTETGFYYLQSRYYDPVVGRFISPDSTDFLGVTGTTLSLNLFAYCENNAVNNVDPSGYKTVSITWIAPLVNAAIILIPAIFAFNRILKKGQVVMKAFSELGKLIVKKGKKFIKKIDDWLYCQCLTTIGYEISKWFAGTLFAIIVEFCSVGDILQYIVDCLDGKWDNKLDLNKKFKLRIITKDDR